MDMVKKVCQLFCIGFVCLVIDSVNAQTKGEITFSPSEITFDKNGNTSVDVNYNKVTDFYYGDVDADGDIDLTDAQSTLKISLGLDISAIVASDYNLRADVDKDGKVTKTDAELILKKALKIPVTLDTKSSTNANSEIAQVKYIWMDSNSDKELVSMYNNYYNLYNSYTDKFSEAIEVYKKVADIEMNGDTTSSEYSKLYGQYLQLNSETEKLETELKNQKESIDTYMKNKTELLTATGNTITGNIGTEKVDAKYLYVEVTTKSGETYTAINIADTSAFDWNTYLASLNNSTLEDAEQIEGIDENPDTSVFISLINVILAFLIGALIVKRKNMFNRI